MRQMVVLSHKTSTFGEQFTARRFHEFVVFVLNQALENLAFACLNFTAKALKLEIVIIKVRQDFYLSVFTASKI
jgi:hypothetical protein